MAEEDTFPPAPGAPPFVLSRAAGRDSGTIGTWSERFARRLVLGRLGDIESGRLEIREGGVRRAFGQRAGDSPLTGRLRIEHPRAWRSFAWGGSIGAAESYRRGWWSSPDLTAVVCVLARNRDALERVEGGAGAAFQRIHQIRHRLRRNSRAGSRRNIAEHYDAGNALFAAFLDAGMTYSCALFEREDASLEAAQEAKLDLVCRKLDLGPDDRVVEIGSGWGSFAIHAARNHGCEVVTTTISERQFGHVTRAVADAGLAQRVTVLREDYRTLAERFPGRFTKLASIEMVEAVGHAYLPAYFQTVHRLLRPDGLALLQAILIPDQRYEAYRRSVDFIQRYIFPGGLLPSLARLQGCAARNTDLRLLDYEDLTPHYARTLACWRERFEAAEDRVAALGLTAAERRQWRFYFAYCEGGFLERTIASAQLLYARAAFRGPVPASGGAR